MSYYSDLDPRRVKLIELSQFVLNRRTENIRSELQEYLISNAIYHKKDENGLTREQIQESLKEFYGLDVPPKLLELCLQRLESRNDILIQHRDKEIVYILSEEKLKEISSHNEEYLALREKVIQEFLTRIGKSHAELSEEEITKIVHCFFSFFSLIFEKYGSRCSGVITGKIGEIKDITEFPDFHAVCLNSVKKIENPSLRKIVLDEFRNYFENPTKEFIYFLYSVAQSYTIAQILNLDPELQSLEKESFSKKKLYLDTNIIVSLMCVAQFHESVSEVVSLTRDLGIQMVFTPETKREYLGLLNRSKELYKTIPTYKKEVIQKVEPLMEDPFIRSFWMESKVKEAQSWDGFVVKIEVFQEYLRDKYDIIMEETRIEGIWKDPELSNLDAAVSSADISKPQSAVSHDAYHILLIKKLRERESVDELGMGYYFLTRDYTLMTAESLMYKGGIPNNVHIDIWFQMIFPFLSPKIILEEPSGVYVKLLSSQFPSLTRTIDPRDLIDLMGLWMEDPDIDTETLRKIIGSHYVQQHLQNLREMPKKEPSQVSQMLDPFLKETITNVKEGLKKSYDKKIAELEKSIEELKTTKEKKISKPLFFTGLVLFFALILCGFIASYLNLNLSDTIYSVLGIAGTALIASSVFGPTIFEKFKHL